MRDLDFPQSSLSVRRQSLCCLAVAVLLLSGCTSAPTRFYVLTPMQAVVAVDGVEGLSLGIDPLRLPALLDRPHIVTRVDDNERQLAEFARWAEPLDENMTRVLAENLSALLGTEQVVRLPAVRYVRTDQRLAVQVLRFDATPGETAVLEVRWRLFDSETGAMQVTRHESFVAELPGNDHGAAVGAMSEALAALSRAVAAELGQGGHGM